MISKAWRGGFSLKVKFRWKSNIEKKKKKKKKEMCRKEERLNSCYSRLVKPQKREFQMASQLDIYMYTQMHLVWKNGRLSFFMSSSFFWPPPPLFLPFLFCALVFLACFRLSILIWEAVNHNRKYLLVTGHADVSSEGRCCEVESEVDGWLLVHSLRTKLSLNFFSYRNLFYFRKICQLSKLKFLCSTTFFIALNFVQVLIF